MAGTKRYKLTPSHQRVTWKPVPTTRGTRLKQVAIAGTEVHVSPSTPSGINLSPNCQEHPDDNLDVTPLNLPHTKVSESTIGSSHHYC